MLEPVLFYLASALLLVSATMTVASRNPLRGALWLVGTLAVLAMHFVLLEAGFVAAMQILVYAGAIMVLFVFVIMLLNLGPHGSNRPAYLSVAKVLGVAAVATVVWRVLAGLRFGSGDGGSVVDGSVRSVGTVLLRDYLFAFEAVSVLLLVAVVGGVVLGLRRLT